VVAAHSMAAASSTAARSHRPTIILPIDIGDYFVLAGSRHSMASRLF